MADQRLEVLSDEKQSRAVSPSSEPATLAGQYSGPTSAYSFLRRAWRRFGLHSAAEQDREPSQAVPIFSYGDREYAQPGISDAGLKLPDRPVTAQLLASYFDFAMPTYRFLHQPSVADWLESYHQQLESGPEKIPVLASRQAVVLMVLATASLFLNDPSLDATGPVGAAKVESERYLQAAQQVLASETGKARLESVQARLAICLYLLHTSRPNQAWYTFGVTVQLLTALGMHRVRVVGMPQLDTITIECRKRTFWAAFTLDTYLGVILGRPSLIHSDDVDQPFPEAIDDEEIHGDGIFKNGLRKDRIVQASIHHAVITRIVKKAVKEQYSVHRSRGRYRPSMAAKLNSEVADWRASLPVVLSGAIHPSSLIQIFQRQIVVLELAHSLATILINRPLLLTDCDTTNHSHVNACLSAAKSTLDVVKGFVANKRTFPSFWYTQYVTFNALSIVYVWLIQRKRGRLVGIDPAERDDELYELAEMVQRHLSDATQTNAPSLRYSIILEELQHETQRLMMKSHPSRPPELNAIFETPTESHSYATPINPAESSPSSNRPGSIGWDSIGREFPLDLDLWLELDSLPLPEIDFEGLTGLM